MKISCVVPAWNCEAYLSRAVESLLSTEWRELEVIVVDDGSTDGTWGVAEALAARHPGIVRCEKHAGGRNRGVSASRNLGVARSSGELICFLDGDDLVYPHRFITAARILREQPRVDGVHELTDVVFEDASAERAWGMTARTMGFDRPLGPGDVLFELLRGRCWATSGILIRRAFLDQTGGFDPRLAIAEDCNLWFRLASVGTLVSGDRGRAVSAYWRRAGSAYRPGTAPRVHMIRAMVLFYRWLLRRDGRDARLPAIDRSIRNYILQSIHSARGDGERMLAWTIVGGSVIRFPQVVKERRLYGHIRRMAVGQ